MGLDYMTQIPLLTLWFCNSNKRYCQLFAFNAVHSRREITCKTPDFPLFGRGNHVSIHKTINWETYLLHFKSQIKWNVCFVWKRLCLENSNTIPFCLKLIRAGKGSGKLSKVIIETGKGHDRVQSEYRLGLQTKPIHCFRIKYLAINT